MSDQGNTAVADQPTQATDKQKAPVYTAEHPEYPKVLYNSKTRTTAVANDKDAETKLTGKGYSKDPYPPLAPDALTKQDIQELESLLHKAVAEIAKYSSAAQTTASGAAGAAGSTGPSGTGGTGSQDPVPGAVAYAGATGAKDATGSQATTPSPGAATGATGQGTATSPAAPPKK